MGCHSTSANRSGPFDRYVIARYKSGAQSVAAHIEALPEAEQAQAKNDLVALLRLYKEAPGQTNAQVWNSFKNEYEPQKQLVVEGPRQISHLQRGGDTMETAYLKHLDPELHAWYRDYLSGVLLRVEAGELGPAFLREIARTHSVMYSPNKPPSRSLGRGGSRP